MHHYGPVRPHPIVKSFLTVSRVVWCAPSHLRVWCFTVTVPRGMKTCTASRIGANLNRCGTHPFWSRCSTSLAQAHFLAYSDVDDFKANTASYVHQWTAPNA
ncbi:hypothetical protein TRVL_08974 [Trypanosoma vivax]|nr:hypothetical protein TRVL_08974 [Trypanosoma vivax]